MSAESRYQTITLRGARAGWPADPRPAERLSESNRQMIDGAERDADIRDGLKAALAWRNDRFGS